MYMYTYIPGTSWRMGGFHYDGQVKVFCKVVCESSLRRVFVLHSSTTSTPPSTPPRARPIFMRQTSL